MERVLLKTKEKRTKVASVFRIHTDKQLNSVYLKAKDLL